MKYLLTVVCCAVSLTAVAQLALVKDINPGWSNGNPVSFSILNNKLYFLAEHGILGRELWSHDAASGNTTMVADINPEKFASNYLVYDGQTCTVGNHVYFVANDSVHGEELWKYDGVNQPVMVVNLAYLSQSSSPRHMNTLGGKLYFAAYADNVGHELHCYDPATSAVTVVEDISPGTTSTTISMSAVFNGKLHFGAWDHSVNALELWVHDPVANTTTKVGSGTQLALTPHLTVAFNKLYFVGESSTYGRELYSYDGVNAPVRLTDLAPGPDDGVADLPGVSVIGYKGKVYFRGYLPGGTTPVMCYDPAANTAGFAFTAPQFDSASAGGFCEYAGRLYFSATEQGSGSPGDELYRYDGTNQPQLAADLWAGSLSGAPAYGFVYSNHLYFSAVSLAAGRELYEFYDSDLGVGTIKFTALINVYPNPSTDIFSMDMTLQQAATFAVQVYDMAGRRVYNGGMQQYENGKHHLSVPAAAFAPGNYTLQLRTNAGETFYTSKLVKL